MKRIPTLLNPPILLAALLLAPLDALHALESSRPNVLFILADDLGWGDLRCYGNPVIDTPALDALARDGVRFTAHYSPSPLCSPARAGYLTGRFNHRTGAVDVPSNRGLDRIDLSEKTFGDYFHHAGHATALIGKWHNGLYCRDYLPHRRGFDLFYGFPNGGQDYWKWNLLRNDDAVAHDGRYLTDALNAEAIRFIGARRARPFALFLAHHAPHSPLQAPEPLVRKYRQRLGEEASEAVAVTYAMIEAMDAGLGRVFQALKDQGQWEQTITVFTSDNGPWLARDPDLGSQMRFNGGFSGQKQDVLEGGIRVPGIVAWPGRIPAGQVIPAPVHGCDWLPTLLSLTGARVPVGDNPFDGLNLTPLLMGDPTPALTERALMFQRNRYAPVPHCNAAIREGRWKLHWPGDDASLTKDGGRDNPSYLRGLVRPHWEMPLDRQLDPPTTAPQPPPRLYDLDADPAEKRDLAAAHPEIVQRLARKHEAWFAEILPQWERARTRILDHDRAHWTGRATPDPAALFEGFWLWKSAPKGTDPKAADPLKIFRGFWNDGEEDERGVRPWPPARKIFAHHVPWHPPSHARPDRTADAGPGLESQIVHAADAGIDGFAVDVVRKPPTQMVGMLVDMAWIAQRRAPGFAIMPCLDCAATQSVADWEAFLLGWLAAAGELPATFRVNGAPVIFTYGAYEIAPADWATLRQRMLQAGHRLFLIGEMNALYRNRKDPLPRIREYADLFDGLYFFAPNTVEHERALIGIERSDGRPLLRLFSPSPGYWRENTGSFARPFRGTRTYRDSWDLACELPVHWISITSWNDYTEHHHIEPARLSSDACGRLTRIGAARFRDRPVEPVTGPESFWLTAPSEMPDGPGAAPLEADTRRETIFEILRVGPPSTASLAAKVSIARPTGEVIEERTLELAADKPVTDRQFQWQPDREFGDPYLVVTASVGALGARLPLPLWPRNVARRYHMAPRRVRLVAQPPPRPIIALDRARLTVSTIPGESSWRTDLLHNLMPMLDPKSRTAQVAEGAGQLPGTNPDWGFWEAATVTPDARVTWADPLYIPPRGDLATLALYRFDDPAKPTADDSIYARHGRPRGRLVKLGDGGHALACDTESWFEPSGSFCPLSCPLTVELWARPERPGGMLWGDVGAAMLLGLTAEGKPLASRRQASDGKRAVAGAERPLAIGRWSHLAGVFDGRSVRLYVDGALAAQAPCTGPSGSSRMAVGRNPYDQTSIFTGLVDDVRITARALAPDALGPVPPGKARPADPDHDR